MALFNENVQKQISDFLTDMKNDVRIAFFTQEVECPSCREMRNFLEELTALSPKLFIDEYDFVKDEAKAKELGIERIPAVAVLDSNSADTRMHFYGVPGGYEINSFLISLVEASGTLEAFEGEVAERIKAIDKDVHIQVFVTMGCPHCPQAVINAHRLALENPHIKADMVEASTFPELSMKYQVSGVPKIVINEEHDLLGAQPISKFLDAMENASATI